MQMIFGPDEMYPQLFGNFGWFYSPGLNYTQVRKIYQAVLPFDQDVIKIFGNIVVFVFCSG